MSISTYIGAEAEASADASADASDVVQQPSVPWLLALAHYIDPNCNLQEYDCFEFGSIDYDWEMVLWRDHSTGGWRQFQDELDEWRQYPIVQAGFQNPDMLHLTVDEWPVEPDPDEPDGWATRTLTPGTVRCLLIDAETLRAHIMQNNEDFLPCGGAFADERGDEFSVDDETV